MHYDDAIKFIYDLELFGIKMGLENIKRFLERLGNPQNSFKSIHVAGTNGKGSVCALLFSILKESRYRVGLFTSPHLVDFRERVRTDTGVVSKRFVADFIEEHRQFILDSRVTFFELSTAIAFWHFKKMRVEIAVVEVGLGGRLDATNVLQPMLSVITHIDYDHTSILGDSLHKIAIEKAGIIKNSVPLVTGERKSDVYALFRDVCRERSARIVRAPTTSRSFSVDRNRMRVHLPVGGDSTETLTSPLIGQHQMENLSIVTKCLGELDRSGIRIPVRALKSGVKNCRWPARFQLVGRNPSIILDVAHNPDGMSALVKTFKAVFPGKRAIVVCGFLERPDFDVMVEELSGVTRRAVITRPVSDRAAEIEGVIWAAVNAGIDFDVKLVVRDAVDRALKICSRKDILLICGSHYLMGDAILRLVELHKRKQLELIAADITNING